MYFCPNSFHHPSFLECSRALELAVESFVNEAAKKKAEYDAHEAALATILAHAEGTIESKERTREGERAKKTGEKKTKTKKRRRRRRRALNVMMVHAESILELRKMQTKSMPLMKTKKRARGKASENF